MFPPVINSFSAVEDLISPDLCPQRERADDPTHSSDCGPILPYHPIITNGRPFNNGLTGSKLQDLEKIKHFISSNDHFSNDGKHYFQIFYDRKIPKRDEHSIRRQNNWPYKLMKVKMNLKFVNQFSVFTIHEQFPRTFIFEDISHVRIKWFS